jgi:hypothetical protein
MVFYGWSVLGALVSTIPIGPINLFLISLSMMKATRSWWAVVAGIILVDSVYSLLALGFAEFMPSYWNLEDSFSLKVGLNLALTILFAVWAIVTFKQSRGQTRQARTGFQLMQKALQPNLKTLLLAFVFGALGTLVEAGLPLFWSLWWMKGPDVETLQPAGRVIACIFGIATGDLLIFGSYRIFASQLGDRMKKLQRLHMEHVVAFIFAIAALWFGFQTLKMVFLPGG